MYWSERRTSESAEQRWEYDRKKESGGSTWLTRLEIDQVTGIYSSIAMSSFLLTVALLARPFVDCTRFCRRISNFWDSFQHCSSHGPPHLQISIGTRCSRYQTLVPSPFPV